MPTTNSRSCKVLAYGYYELLLQTRRDLLILLGITTDLSLTSSEFLECITSSERKYDLFILCHSVPPAEQEVIIEAAHDFDVEIYVLRELTLPEQFLTAIRHLAGRW